MYSNIQSYRQLPNLQLQTVIGAYYNDVGCKRKREEEQPLVEITCINLCDQVLRKKEQYPLADENCINLCYREDYIKQVYDAEQLYLHDMLTFGRYKEPIPYCNNCFDKIKGNYQHCSIKYEDGLCKLCKKRSDVRVNEIYLNIFRLVLKCAREHTAYQAVNIFSDYSPSDVSNVLLDNPDKAIISELRYKWRDDAVNECPYILMHKETMPDYDVRINSAIEKIKCYMQHTPPNDNRFKLVDMVIRQCKDLINDENDLLYPTSTVRRILDTLYSYRPYQTIVSMDKHVKLRTTNIYIGRLMLANKITDELNVYFMFNKKPFQRFV